MSEPTPAMTAARCGCTAEQVDAEIVPVPAEGYAEANARLIATAPQMLEALKKIEKWTMLTQTNPLPWLDSITEIITSIEGSKRQ